MHALVERGIFTSKCKNLGSSENASSIQMVLYMVGWLTFLYKPIYTSHPQQPFRVDQESVTLFQYPSQSFEENKTGSIDSLIHRFGDILPQKPLSQQSQPVDDVIRVPLLNAAHLWKIKEIRIRWTMTIGTHLALDKSTKTLSIFCMPSVLLFQKANPGPLTR